MYDEIVAALKGKLSDTVIYSVEETADRIMVKAVCPTLIPDRLKEQFVDALQPLQASGILNKSVELNVVSEIFPYPKK